MKPKHHTNYIRFPKKLKRMKKYVSKSRRGTNIFGDYRGVYVAARWIWPHICERRYLIL